MDAFTKSKRRVSRTNQNSQQSTPATQSSTTDAPEPRRHGLSGQKPQSKKSALQPQDDKSDDQDMDFDEDGGDQTNAIIDQNDTPGPQRRGLLSQKSPSKKSDPQPHDDESDDQGMKSNKDGGNQINATIDQNDKQVGNAAFDETDSEDTDKTPEELALMRDPSMYVMRKGVRKWVREATSKELLKEMKYLVAFDTDLDEKEAGLGKYAKAKQRGLSADDRRDREINNYKLELARKRYRHDNPSSERSFDADATAGQPSQTTQKDLGMRKLRLSARNWTRRTPYETVVAERTYLEDELLRLAETARDRELTADEKKGLEHDTYLMQRVEMRLRDEELSSEESSDAEPTAQEPSTPTSNQQSTPLPANQKNSDHYAISEILDENETEYLVRWEDSWVLQSWVNAAAKRPWIARKKKEKAQQAKEKKKLKAQMKVQKNDASNDDVPEEDSMEGRDDD
jgi:hypothetical protein